LLRNIFLAKQLLPFRHLFFISNVNLFYFTILHLASVLAIIIYTRHEIFELLKFKKAFCPEGIVEDNPVLEYCKYIIFEKFKSLKIERPEKFGGNITYNSYDELETAFANKELHPMDLKNSASKYINELIEPVRKHFEENPEAKALLEKVNEITGSN